MLPAARLDVHLFPRHLDHGHQQALGQPVLAHHARRERAAGLGQRELPVVGHVQQAVPLHPGDRLADRRPGLGEALRDPRAQRDDPLLFKFEHRPEVHLRSVDKPMGSH